MHDSKQSTKQQYTRRTARKSAALDLGGSRPGSPDQGATRDPRPGRPVITRRRSERASGLDAAQPLGRSQNRSRDRSQNRGQNRSPNNSLGRYGEEVAARRLAADGLRILERNWRCVEGELDIVALDGDTLAVCEVKTRSERSFQQPSEAIDATKADRLRRLAERWLSERWPVHFALLAEGMDCSSTVTAEQPWPAPAPPGGVRIDLVAVINRIKGAASVDHLRGVV